MGPLSTRATDQRGCRGDAATLALTAAAIKRRTSHSVSEQTPKTLVEKKKNTVRIFNISNLIQIIYTYLGFFSFDNFVLTLDIFTEFNSQVMTVIISFLTVAATVGMPPTF